MGYNYTHGGAFELMASWATTIYTHVSPNSHLILYAKKDIFLQGALFCKIVYARPQSWLVVFGILKKGPQNHGLFLSNSKLI